MVYVLMSICPAMPATLTFKHLTFFFDRVIRTRQQQRNFQLVIITHDEEFVENLGRADFVDYYFRIYKDER